VNCYTLRFTEVENSETEESQSPHPLLLLSQKPIAAVLRVASNRRGSQVGREAAAAVSAGLNRMLSRGIEDRTSNNSPRVHEVDLSSGRTAGEEGGTTGGATEGRDGRSRTPPRNVSSRTENSKKFMTTVRNFGSSVDDDSTHIREPDSLKDTSTRREGPGGARGGEDHYFDEEEEDLESSSNYVFSPIQDSPSPPPGPPPPNPTPHLFVLTSLFYLLCDLCSLLDSLCAVWC
jgi:hypothetical protein